MTPLVIPMLPKPQILIPLLAAIFKTLLTTEKSFATATLWVGTAVGALSYLSKAHFLPAGVLLVGTLVPNLILIAPHLLLLITHIIPQSPTPYRVAHPALLMGIAVFLIHLGL